MKILWHSNAPFVGTGYGNQTDIVSRWLKQHGHEVYIAGFHGHSGAILNFNGIPVLPSSYEAWGNDVILSHYDYYRPDVYFMLMDAWVLNQKILDALPAAVWAPVDSTPIAPPVFEALTHVRWPVAMSRHGERQMRFAGIDPLYVPHMVETDVFKPIDRAQARATYGFTEKQFVVSIVAANKGTPSRKNLDRLLCAWSHFVQKYPDSILYMHTNPYPLNSGLDLMEICTFYDLRFHEGTLQPGQNLAGYQVVFPDQYRMLRGDYQAAALNNLYNASDAFILPSSGEGFGIPVIEAQAAGCPVIVTDYTALSELGEVGYKIPIDPIDDLAVNLQSTHYCQPKISGIIYALEKARYDRGNDALRQKAREFAMNYDAETIMTRHMLPAMTTMAQGNADYMQFHEYRKRPAARPPYQMTAPPDGRDSAILPECREKGHDWSPTGVWNDKGELSAPCRRAGCEAELRRTATGWTVNPTGFKSEVNGIPLDIEDDPQGGVAKIIMREIEQNYDLDEIDFQPGDVVIDIGAQVGIVSIYLAKKYPGITVYAYEPVPENFARFKRNIEANGVYDRINALAYAVTSDGRELTLSGDPSSNSGGISAFTTPNGHSVTVPSMTLNGIIAGHVQKWERIKLLKIDCGGAEYEILQNAGDLLSKVDHLRGEFHSNERLKKLGCDPAALDSYCEQFIPDVKVNACEIAS